MSNQLNIIRHFIETKCKIIGNGSYVVPPDLYREFLSLIKNVNIVNKSYFGKINYWIVNQYPYKHKNASFVVKDNKVYIVYKDTWYYTGCILEGDNTFEKIRINLYNNNIQILFDYCINGYRSAKTLNYELESTRVTGNNQIAEIIHNYRANYYCSPQKAIEFYKDLQFLLRKKEKSRDSILPLYSTTFPPGTSVYVLSEKYFNKISTISENGRVNIENSKRNITDNSLLCSLSPHPFDYTTILEIQNAIRSVDVPSITVESAFITNIDSETIYIYCNFRKPITEDICKAIFESVLSGKKCKVLSDTYPIKDEIMDITDAYDIFSVRWVSDVLSYQNSNNNSSYDYCTDTELQENYETSEDIEFNYKIDQSDNLSEQNPDETILPETTLSLF